MAGMFDPACELLAVTPMDERTIKTPTLNAVFAGVID
jgi:hypothetical protein